MRLTYGVLLPVAMAQAEALRARTGYTPQVWAASLAAAMTETPPGPQRDALFSRAMRVVGINVSGLADFEKKTEEIASRAWENRASGRAREQMERDSRDSGTPWDSAQLAFAEARIQQSDLQQRVSDRFRERDAAARRHERSILPDRPELAHHGNDRAKLRATVAWMADQAGERDHVRLPVDMAGRSLRDQVAASFDMHEARELFADPLMDGDLIGATDAA